jgi:hypothetical protein
MRRVCLTFAVAASLGALATAGWTQGWPTAAEAAQLLTRVGTGAASFTPAGPVATYTRANLWEYIDGDAERYFAYDYQWTAALALKDTKSGTRISADLYCFRTDLDAFGAFSMGRDPAPPAQVDLLPGQGSALTAYWAGNQLHVWRGPLYLRVIPGSLKPDIKPSVLALAQAVLKDLPPMKQDPTIFRIPSARGLIPESVRFERKAVLGQEALRNALIASYGSRLPGKLTVDMELYLFDGSTQPGAVATFATLQDLLSGEGSPRPVAALGEAAFALRHARYGQTYVMRQGTYVAMLRQVKDNGAAENRLREIGTNARLAK